MSYEQLVLSTISKTSGDSIIATDAEGLIRFWNPGAARLFGFSVEEALGQSLDLIIPETLRARHWDGFHQTMATGKSRYGDGDVLAVPAITKAGTRISVEFTIMMMLGGDAKPVGTVAILRDVSARFEELQSLRRKLREVTQNN